MRFLRTLFTRLPASRRQVGELKFLILNAQEKIMATNKELLLAGFAAVSGTLDKIKTETEGLKAEVARLGTALEQANDVPQEVLDAFTSVQGKVQAVDDLVPDTVPTPENPNPESPETPETPAEGSTDEGTAQA